MKERVEKYLRLMGKRFLWAEELNSFLVEERILGDEVHVIVRLLKSYVQILMPVFKLSGLDDDERLFVFKSAMTLNHVLAKTEFEYSEYLDMILISNEIFNDVLTFDLFELNYNAIIFSVSEFFKVIKKRIKDFKSRFLQAYEPLEKALNLIMKRFYKRDI